MCLTNIISYSFDENRKGGNHQNEVAEEFKDRLNSFFYKSNHGSKAFGNGHEEHDFPKSNIDQSNIQNGKLNHMFDIDIQFLFVMFVHVVFKYFLPVYL